VCAYTGSMEKPKRQYLNSFVLPEKQIIKKEDTIPSDNGFTRTDVSSSWITKEVVTPG